MALSLLLTACHSDHSHAPEATDAERHAEAGGGSWSVTAWGERYEVFADVEALGAGQGALAHTHVTVLDGFVPLPAGRVEIVLSDAQGEQVFRGDEPARDGLFTIEILGRASDRAALEFRVYGDAGNEVIRGGEVRIGDAAEPGGPLELPASQGATEVGEPLVLLKEQQWGSDFATSWVERGRLAESVAGPVRLRAPAGGEVVVTAPVDGVLRPPGGRSGSWPFVGMKVEGGMALARLVPHVATGESLASLEAEVAIAATELAVARGHVERLEQLWDLEAVSRREVDEARARVETSQARHAAALQDLESARSARQGGGTDSLTLRAPFTGEVAEVVASPGSTVVAGTELARLVRTDPVWLEVALVPAAARRLAMGTVASVVLSGPEVGLGVGSEAEPIRVEDVTLVSIAPELSARTGTVAVLLQTPRIAELPLGTVVDGQILLQEEREGIVIPASALVDDGGVLVVYLQLEGETFVRQPVEVVERQGAQVLVEGLRPGQRLVSRGGAIIRRAALMASGDDHGHVH